MRVAIYFTPSHDDPLTVAAAAWLGRDAYTGARLPPPEGIDAAHWDAVVGPPRRYGFHATIKAPFRLAGDATIADVDAALRAFAEATPAPMVDTLHLEPVDGFRALVPAGRPAALHAMADAAVESFDRFRLPLTEAELARRHEESLDPVQAENLARWGYPHTHESFRFHMTLTGRIGAAGQAVDALLAERFAPFVGRPRAIDALALFVERAPGADFVVHSRHLLAAG